MVCVYCKKKKKQWKELSFHRFPKDEKLRLEWVKNMGWRNWIPKQYHALCSLHFPKISIDYRDYKARLRKGSIPIFFDENREKVPALDPSPDSDHLHKKIKTDFCGSLDEPVDVNYACEDASQSTRIRPAPENHSVQLEINEEKRLQGKSEECLILEDTSTGLPSTEYSEQSKSEDIIFECVTPHGTCAIVRHDHTYNTCAETAMRKVRDTLNRAAKWTEKNDQREKYDKRRHRKLREIIECIRNAVPP